MRQNRDLCIQLVFGHEKGFVNRPKTDAGGATNMGITQKTLSGWRGYAVSIEEVKRLSKSEAYEIYAANYWTPIRGDDLPFGLDYAVFDSCVTSGANRAIKILQTTLRKAGVTNVDGSQLAIDGVIGVQTLAAIKRYPKGIVELIRAYCAERLAFMQRLKGPKGFKSNGRGWTIRVTGIDPKGEWARQPGVIGVAMDMARKHGTNVVVEHVPDVVRDEIAAKTDDSPTVSIPDVINKPEGYTGLLSAIAAILAAIQANTVLSYALAVAVVVAVGIAGVYFYRRLKTADV